MLEEFLSHTHTTKLCDRNFTEWHKGISHYGFWAVLIDSINCLQRVSAVQSHLSEFFLPAYKRQAHITLNSCGLMADTHFAPSKLDQQISALNHLKASPFDILVTNIDSFSTAAYLEVEDINLSLQKIHTALSTIACDSPPLSYQPHITLGLYREEFKTEVLTKKIMQFAKNDPIALRVNEVQFCRYETSSIQGPIEVIKRIPLTH